MRLGAIPEEAPLHEWVGLLQRATIMLALFPTRVALSLRLLQLGRAPQEPSGGRTGKSATRDMRAIDA
ncbi:hypothetical protein SAMN06272737_1445 [Blastococcus mobilis]|uniref:Uncharacterized protein n=1 Tax=Blastococcus mobilis TaxID=1938746 RepID=A0A239AHC9_9ACTN|nr:hypothetical protein SAMN06272737_1445 [Blastococcus mobilis]